MGAQRAGPLRGDKYPLAASECTTVSPLGQVLSIELSIDYRIPAAAPRCGRASVSGSYTCLVSLRIALARAALTTPRCALWVTARPA